MKVVQCDSFQEAGLELGMSRSAISKHIALLERNLGVTLLNRTPRSISLTDVGGAFYRNCLQISEAIERAAEEVRGRDERPWGLLRVSLPSSLGAALMPSLVSDFLGQCPELRMNVHFGDQFVDVVGGGYDVVLRVSQKLVDSSLFAKRIATTPRVLVASPGYLGRHGVPKHPKELQRHHCLGRGKATLGVLTWSFSAEAGPVEVPVSCAFSASSDLALILASCLDMGFLYVPELLVAGEVASGKLQKVLPSYCRGQDFGVFAIHPYKKCPAKVRVFIEFVERHLKTAEKLDRWSPLARQ